MSVHVYNKDCFNTLRQHVADQRASQPRRRKNELGSALASYDSEAGHFSNFSVESQLERVQEKHDKLAKEQEASNAKIQAMAQEHIRKKQAKRDAEFIRLCSELDEGRKLADQIQERIDLQEASKNIRKNKMYEEWYMGVYKKSMDPINEQIDQIGYKQLSKNRREAYQRFLNTTNKKGALFRDIIIESEYNPLADNVPIKARVHIDNPCARVITRREEEEAIANEGKRPNLDPRARRGASTAGAKDIGRNDNLDVKLWRSGIFEATPYGYFNKKMSSPSKEDLGKGKNSRIKFDDYNIERGYAVVKAELPRGKRTEFNDTFNARKSQIVLRDASQDFHDES